MNIRFQESAPRRCEPNCGTKPRPSRIVFHLHFYAPPLGPAQVEDCTVWLTTRSIHVYSLRAGVEIAPEIQGRKP